MDRDFFCNGRALRLRSMFLKTICGPLRGHRVELYVRDLLLVSKEPRRQGLASPENLPNSQ